MRLFKTARENKRGVLFSIALAGAVLSAPLSAQATVIYWTNQTLGQIDAYNTSTNTNAVIDSNANTPDSLIFANNGNSIIYGSNPNSGSNLYIYNIAAKTNTVLATGSQLGNTGTIRDLALTPSGNSVLVSTYTSDVVYKVNIATGSVSSFVSGANPQGIVFTSSGNLFLNLGSGIEQLNPTTGAVIQTSTAYGNLDGLTYDPTTGFLYATTGVSGTNPSDTIIQINPQTLAESLLTISGSGLNLDGIEATANGNLIIANYYTNMLEYNTATQSTSVLTAAAGIDDVAPLVGTGSQLSGTPEPGSFVLFGTAMILMALLAMRSRKESESC